MLNRNVRTLGRAGTWLSWYSVCMRETQALSLAFQTPAVADYTYIRFPALRSGRQEDWKFWVSLCYIVNLEPAWYTRDPV